MLKHKNVNLDNTFMELLDSFITYINKRFGKLQEPPIKNFTVFDHRQLPTNKTELVKYGKSDIQSLVEYFEVFLTEEEQDLIEDQWLELKIRLN